MFCMHTASICHLPIAPLLCIIAQSKAMMGTSKPLKTGSESEVRCEADTIKTVENPPEAVKQKSVDSG
jgi:hypothetical protein